MNRVNHTLLALVVLAAVAGCQRDDAGSAAVPPSQPDTNTMQQGPGQSAPTPAEAERRPILAISDSQPAHLVDGAGQALYVLEGNDDGSRCDAACENAWPPVQAEEAQPLTGPGGYETRLGSMPRPDGGLHVTYHGQPLYRYAADSGVGATAGHGVEDQWGAWSLVTPEGPPLPQ